jgi:hypothetical protein
MSGGRVCLVMAFTISSPLDFFFWIYIQDKVYAPPLKSNVGKFKGENGKGLWEGLS